MNKKYMKIALGMWEANNLNNAKISLDAKQREWFKGFASGCQAAISLLNGKFDKYLGAYQKEDKKHEAPARNEVYRKRGRKKRVHADNGGREIQASSSEKKKGWAGSVRGHGKV